MTKSIFTPNALEGETVVITGASRGIGAAIFEACLKAGATVIGTATSEPGAEKITAKAKELGFKGLRFKVLNIADRVPNRCLCCRSRKRIRRGQRAYQ